MGGPGCGKGTQCKNMATKYGFCHVGLGQLLRQRLKGARSGAGRSVTSCCRSSWCPQWTGPQCHQFDCSTETMVRRVLHWGQVEHWADDSELAICQRLDTHYTLCEPVLTFYQQKTLLQNILAEEAPETIFAKHCCH
ncbi:adenylate kinase isoenzyme 1-like [Rhinopithecus roxellana]|uniref:adenylate kinase isoenzyme 1-like n=1 Tax=Rhinopithecus roxellana TaxID=61622 RepID=UPI0012378C9B|nr:adenylate kinase isoenzyme 1-like [Rhinopithecus roxellana]